MDDPQGSGERVPAVVVLTDHGNVVYPNACHRVLADGTVHITSEVEPWEHQGEYLLGSYHNVLGMYATPERLAHFSGRREDDRG